MKLKNRKGSTLALTLMIFAVLMIFATFTLGFMVTENKQAMYHQNKTQAYYLARSGAVAVESAIKDVFLNDGKEGYNTFISDINDAPIDIGWNNSSFSDITVTLSKEYKSANELYLYINATAIVKGVEQNVVKVLTVDITPGQPEEITLGEEAIVALDVATLDENTKAQIKAISLLMKPNEIIKYPKYNFEYSTYNSIPKSEDDEINPIDNLEVWGDKTLGKANETTNYYINGNLKISSNADIVVLGDVNIYVRGYMHVDGVNNNTVNFNIYGNKEKLKVYVYGENKIFNNYTLQIAESESKTANFNFRGNIFVNTGDILFLTKDSIYEGNLISNGNIINLSAQTSNGVDHHFKGIIYAPETDIYIRNPSSISENFTLYHLGYIIGRNVEYLKIHNDSIVVKPNAEDGVSKPVVIPGLDFMVVKDGFFR